MSEKPLPLPPLKHKYFALRHGHSIPNEKQIIVASMKNGIDPRYSLSAKGREQALEAGHSIFMAATIMLERLGSNSILFLVSPFSRAQDTAQIAASFIRDRLKTARVELRTIRALRERFFGDSLELQPDTRYAEVWSEDAQQQPTSTFGAESVTSVWNRVVRVVASIEEEEASPCLVFFVSHGDTLQISEAGFRGLPLHLHRSLKHLNQAEWRELNTPGVGPLLRPRL